MCVCPALLPFPVEKDRNQWDSWEDLKKLQLTMLVIHGQHNTKASAKLYLTGDKKFKHLDDRPAKIYVNMTREDTYALGAACSRAQSKQRKDNWVEDLKFVHRQWWHESKQNNEKFGKLLAAREYI